MAQFRVTKKFAMDYKLSKLLEPSKTISLLDDWVIDVMRIARKKVAIITHAKTLFTLLIPYSHVVGGAKGIPQCIPLLLKQWLYDRKYSEYIRETERLFISPPTFCKTQSRQILGHMNDFKRCIAVQTFDMPFEVIDWDILMESTNTMPINVRPMGYTSAIEQMDGLLKPSHSMDAH